MTKRDVDVVIIGAGTAGIRAYQEVKRCGARVVLIESGPLGTTCARVGCMPSKLLIQAANVANAVRGADRFGIRASLDRIDDAAVLKRVRALRDDFVRSVVEKIDEMPTNVRVTGHARFVAPGLLEAGGTQLATKAVVIATGSTPVLPPPFQGLDDELLSTTDTFFEIDRLPKSIAVIGAGNIGLELGQALHRLGVEMTLLEVKDHLSLVRSQETGVVAQRLFADELDLHLGVEILSATKTSDGVEIEWTEPSGGDKRVRRFDRILCAAGRRPNVSGLNLQSSGLFLGPSGFPEVDQRSMRCRPLHDGGACRVYMAGDVTKTRPVLHEAADEGRIAGLNAASRDGDRSHLRNTPMSIVFTDPQVATVGQGPEGDGVISASSSFENQGRARIMAHNVGEARLYASDRDARLVGADLVMPGAEHVAHLIASWIQSRLTIEEILALPIYHPVLEEGLRGALKRLGARLGLVRRPDDRDLDCGPGG